MPPSPDIPHLRKPPARATRSRNFPLAPVRRRIWEQACDLVTNGEPRDIVAVLANRFKVPKGTVHLALVAEGMRHERTAATLRTGIANALALARDAEVAVVKDLSEVA